MTNVKKNSERNNRMGKATKPLAGNLKNRNKISYVLSGDGAFYIPSPCNDAQGTLNKVFLFEYRKQSPLNARRIPVVKKQILNLNMYHNLQ